MTLIQLFMVSTRRSVKAWGRETYYGESVGAFVPYVYMESGVLKDFGSRSQSCTI